MRKIYDAIIIGSGAAAYSAADWLYRQDVKNIAVLTENRMWGTSRNTGSDKQTYYKLSMDGFVPDSPYKMAQDIYETGSCDGEKMYLEALHSTRCFLRLCDYGVGFPRDKFGAFPGYKTDHDNTLRATSIGPLTSKVMTQKLEDAVINKNNTPVFDNRQVVEIIKHKNKAAGVVALNTETGTFENFYSKNVICATGAPACIYENSVYPHSQHGMTGVLLEAGVRLCNFSQWQYGMASVDFRWNVSGSFMQVIPSFVSVDEKGNEYDFLSEYFETAEEMCNNIFLKGYQWPFSFGRMNESSRVDIAVHNETKKGRKVYLDYTKNPQGYCFEKLSEEAKEYLLKNDSVADTPIERLKKLNPKAIDVYARQNIDITCEKLRIAVCAQHNNGGVYTDNNCESDIENLYVIGEAAGTFGLARPGGTALNNTQVGGLLVAEHIRVKENSLKDEDFNLISTDKNTDIIIDNSVDYSYIKTKMSGCASFLRSKEECESLLTEIKEIVASYPNKHRSLSEWFYDRDMLVSSEALLHTILGEMILTGSRGGAVFFEKGKEIKENLSYRKYLTITEKGKVSFIETNPVPETNEPFEKYLKEIKE